MPLHPFLVHFVIALFIVSIVLDFAGWILKNEKLLLTGWINLILTALAVLPAIFSGLWEKNRLDFSTPVLHTLDTHQTLAFISAGIILALFFWRLGMKGQLVEKVKILYWIISLTGLISLLSGAYYGGKLVYQYGVGVRSEICPKESSHQNDTNPNFPPQDSLFYPGHDSLP